MNSIILGIDISKETFDVALLINNKVKNKKFNNNLQGFYGVSEWLKTKQVYTAHACMEATNTYGLKLAEYLYKNNFKVSVVNPARVKGFSISKLYRVKTDKADSELIAYFCQTIQPELWQPTAFHIQELQQLVNRLDALISIKNQETNRLEGLFDIVTTNIKSHIKFLNKQIKEIEKLISNHIKKHTDLSDKGKLLVSIPGIGEKTVAVILAFLSDIENFKSVKQVVAFVGLNPQQRQSGTSVHGTSRISKTGSQKQDLKNRISKTGSQKQDLKNRISKTGNADLRKAFYMPAIVSLKFNPIVTEFAKRLGSLGKPKMVIVIAAMRKLIHIIYGVLKNKTLFNEIN